MENNEVYGITSRNRTGEEENIKMNDNVVYGVTTERTQKKMQTM